MEVRCQPDNRADVNKASDKGAIFVESACFAATPPRIPLFFIDRAPLHALVDRHASRGGDGWWKECGVIENGKYAVEAFEAGVLAYLLKPVIRERLHKTLRW